MPTVTKGAKAPKETQKEAIMRILRCSAEEAESILADDKAVDQGQTMEWDLSAEEHKKAMKRANATEHKKPSTEVKRERKVDAEKGGLMGIIVEALAPVADSIGEVVNEREVIFFHNGVKYKLTLAKPRK